jgi:hypothetical protein
MMRQGSLPSERSIVLPLLGRSTGGKHHLAKGPDRQHLMIFSLPHWVAFWAAGEQYASNHHLPCTAKFPVGYRESIINYALKIEDLLAKMDGIRAEVLPLNLQAIVDYFTNVWEFVRTLTAPVLSLQPLQHEPDKFKSYIEAEEARLEYNLRAVHYTIDGADTLTLITGVGRIEKVST